MVRRTGRTKPVEPGALTQEEVITEIIGPGIEQANADLERRNRDAPPAESKPKPLDRATLRFIEP